MGWISTVFFTAALGMAAGSAAAAEPKATFRYFRSDRGVCLDEAALPDHLEVAAALRWRVALDSGHSTPILYQGKIFLTTYHAETKELGVLALDEAGNVLWHNAIVPQTIEQTHVLGNPATATAACDGQRVFVFFGSAGLFAYDLKGGKLWEQHVGPFRDEYGAGSSPILYDDKIILNQDHDTDSFVMAVERATGRMLWKTSRPDAVRSYSTPIIWEEEGRSELLVAGALQLTAYDPANGQRLWWFNGLARIVIPTPVQAGATIYMASWSPGGDAGKRLELDPWSVALTKWDANHDGKLARSEIDDREVLDRFTRMDLDQDGMLDQREWERHAEVFRRAQNSVLALKPSGNGELGPTAVVWKHSRGIPYVATPVLYHGILWMVKEGGIVTKLDATDGRLLQEERLPGFGNYFASPVAGDGKVYFASEAGTVSVLAGVPEWKILSSRDFHEKIYATPLLDSGRLFLRTDRALYCFQSTTSGAEGLRN